MKGGKKQKRRCAWSESEEEDGEEEDNENDDNFDGSDSEGEAENAGDGDDPDAAHRQAVPEPIQGHVFDRWIRTQFVWGFDGGRPTHDDAGL